MTQARQGTLAYRADIDGLRAIAVLLAIGYHIGMPGMAGGFTGVEVFFVISGYLITGLLVRELDTNGGIDITLFYARRMRRLLPVLAVVIATTLVVGALLLLPDQQTLLAKWAMAALAFAANFLAWSMSQNYFAEASTLLPLQHLWTLSVEEQFYLVWPLLLVALARGADALGVPRHRLIVAALVAIFTASLAASILLTPHFPSAAFLLPHTRAWELAAGSLLALAPALPVRVGRWLAPLGLAAIAAGMLSFDGTTPYPSYNALLPAAGAIALIAGGPQGPLNRLLGTRPLVAIGKISYGWYLWHWPVLAFARNLWGNEPALARDGALVLFALLLAMITWRWIETPARRQTIRPFATTRASLVSGLAMLGACAVLAYGLQHWSQRPIAPGSITEKYLAARVEGATTPPSCEADDRITRCELGDPHATTAILVWGDSHAAHLIGGLDPAGRAAHVRVLVRSMGGCPIGGMPEGTTIRESPDYRRQCDDFHDAVLASIPALIRDHQLRGVLFSARWGASGVSNPRLPMLIARLHAAGLRVTLARDTPAQPSNFASCLLWQSPGACALPRADAERRTVLADAMLVRVAAGTPEVRVWSPLDALCPQGRCPAFADGRFLYFDRGHLSSAGSRRLAPALASEIAWLAAPR